MKIKHLFYSLLFIIPWAAFSQTETTKTTANLTTTKKVTPAKGNFFKERIKQRWIKKQKNKPAPQPTIEADKVISKPGDYTIKIISSGLDRYYILHVPPNYKASAKNPLIVAMHGGTGNMQIQANDKYYKLVSKSDKEGFIVAFPNGHSPFKSGILATWNSGKCCGSARDEKIDDVKFLTEMVQNIQKQVSIDPKKVFAIGMSNGGMMAYRLACDTNLFKAIASVTGTDITETCKPKRAVSVLHIHAKDDKNVLFSGGAGEDAFGDKSKITNFTSVPDTIKKWTKLNECPKSAKQILTVPKAYCELYSPCKDKSEVQLCVTEDGGHSWPGGTSPRGQKKAPPSTAIIANDVIWDFFKKK